MAASIGSEPTIVNSRNLIDAYTRRSPPHTPMIRNIGTSISSQNT